MFRQIIKTSDGSHSIYLKEMDEHYHSKHGAIAESQHIFIDKGLLELAKTKRDIRIFEVGMGTGLNVLTTYLAAKKQHLKIDYQAIEAFPIDWAEAEKLNYSDELKTTASVLQQIHQMDWGCSNELAPNFLLTKHHTDLRRFEPQLKYDLIYFDAFAPEKQPEMWGEKIFEALYQALNEGGMLVTYCVKGEIRRRLQKVGFIVEKLAGPPGGKREMCRARKEVG